MSPNTWTAYKKGKQSLKLNHIAEICDMLQVDMVWLLFGNSSGAAAASNAATSVPLLDRKIFRELKRMVGRINGEAGIKLPDEARDEEAIRWYNELLTMARGNLDEAKLRSLLPALEYEIQEAVKRAAAAPGTGKASA
jgi:hypothetical protein